MRETALKREILRMCCVSYRRELDFTTQSVIFVSLCIFSKWSCIFFPPQFIDWNAVLQFLWGVLNPVVSLYSLTNINTRNTWRTIWICFAGIYIFWVTLEMVFFSFFQTSWRVCFCTYRTYYLTDLSLSFPSHLGRPVSLFMRLQETICSKLNVLIFFFYSTYVSECLKWCENWNLPLLSRWPIQACGWFG